MRIALLLIPLLIAARSEAQSRTEMWNKLSVNGQVVPRLTVGADGQFRSQANYFTGSHNPLDRSLGWVFRPWVSWRADSSLTLLFSPVALFVTHRLTGARDQVREYEWRATAGGQFLQTVGSVSVKMRALQEYRWFVTRRLRQQRTRVQGMITVPVCRFPSNSRISVLAGDEVFVTWQNGAASFDHNRLIAGFQLNIARTEWAALWHWQVQAGQPEPVIRNVCFLQGMISLDRK